MIKTFLMIMALGSVINLTAQPAAKTISPYPEKWTAFNREVKFTNGGIYLDSKEGDGVLWLNSHTLGNCTVELDLKGKDVRGQSFVGIAFNGKDDQTFDGVYFRPFNFKSPERKVHSVQYISMPENDWSVLRRAFPGKYENEVSPVPEPDEWFHAKIVVAYPKVSVYVNGSDRPSLVIQQISDQREGRFGLWVGNGSDGWFRDVTILAD